MDWLAEIGKVFQNPFTSQTAILTVVAFAVIVVFIYFVFLFRSRVKKSSFASDRLSPGGIDLNSLKRMTGTGLIQEEEMSRIKQRMADQYLKEEEAPAKPIPTEIMFEQAEMEARRLAAEREAQGKPPHQPVIEEPTPESEPAPEPPAPASSDIQYSEFDPLADLPPLTDDDADDDADDSVEDASEPAAVSAPQRLAPQRLAPEQAALIRKTVDWKKLSLAEAREFHAMGVIDSDELRKIERKRGST